MDDKDYLQLKIELLLKGVRLDENIRVHSRATMASISEGLNIRIGEHIYVTASIDKTSPFTLSLAKNRYLLSKGEITLEVELIYPPNIENLTTIDGTPMERVGSFQIDRARISAFKGCIFGVLKVECKFCEIGDLRKMRKNKLANINEFAKLVEENYKQIRHFLVSGGTPSDKGWRHFIDVCKEIRSVSERPIYAMFSPPHELSVITEMVESGVSEIAINIEFYDQDVARDLIPGKAAIGRQKYIDALEHSVKLLGRNGAVRSILIVGIENEQETLRGVEALASMGVMPILSVFKPLEGTGMASYGRPETELLLSVWEKSQEICEMYGLTLGPTCKCCQNNTLTIPVSDLYV